MLCLQDRNTGFLEPKVAHSLKHSLHRDFDPPNNKHLAESQATLRGRTRASYGLRARRFNWVVGETAGVGGFCLGEDIPF
jgi:hypothetical protein